VSSQTTNTLFFFEIKFFVFLRVNRKAFFASIEQIFERRSSRQWKDVQAKEYPSSIMDETPVRGNWSAHMPRPQSKICLKKENTVSERDKYSSLKDCGKISLQRFRPSIASKKSKIAAAEPTSVYAVDEHASHLGTQFNGRTYNRPETHSPRADCARFMPGHQAKCTKALPACTAGCRPASRW